MIARALERTRTAPLVYPSAYAAIELHVGVATLLEFVVRSGWVASDGPRRRAVFACAVVGAALGMRGRIAETGSASSGS
jgi:hypothetical protein